MQGTVKELENDIEWHLDRDSFTSMMSASDKDSWSIGCFLAASLELDQGNITALIRLAHARDSDMVGELFL